MQNIPSWNKHTRNILPLFYFPTTLIRLRKEGIHFALLGILI